VLSFQAGDQEYKRDEDAKPDQSAAVIVLQSGDAEAWTLGFQGRFRPNIQRPWRAPERSTDRSWCDVANFRIALKVGFVIIQTAKSKWTTLL
jgi:hypothetical protein